MCTCTTMDFVAGKGLAKFKVQVQKQKFWLSSSPRAPRCVTAGLTELKETVVFFYTSLESIRHWLYKMLQRKSLFLFEEKLPLFSLHKEHNTRQQWTQLIFSDLPQKYNPTFVFFPLHFTDGCFVNQVWCNSRFSARFDFLLHCSKARWQKRKQHVTMGIF